MSTHGHRRWLELLREIMLRMIFHIHVLVVTEVGKKMSNQWKQISKIQYLNMFFDNVLIFPSLTTGWGSTTTSTTTFNMVVSTTTILAITRIWFEGHFSTLFNVMSLHEGFGGSRRVRRGGLRGGAGSIISNNSTIVKDYPIPHWTCVWV